MSRSVLLLASATPSRLAVPGSAGRLADAGYELHLVVVGGLAAVPSVEFAEAVSLEPRRTSLSTALVALTAPRTSDAVRHRRGSVPWASRALRRRITRLYRPSLNRALPTWRAVDSDERVRAAAAGADAIIAVDRYAIYSAWKLHKRFGVRAFNGMDAGAQALAGEVPTA